MLGVLCGLVLLTRLRVTRISLANYSPPLPCRGTGSLKRRAVSPGLSVHNSPVISQSPSQRDLWGTAAKASRETSISGQSNGERSNSGGSMSMTPTLGPKRVGLQGMTDTSDGLMKMSIE